MSRPLVSVIVPAYNREDYLGEALDSVCAQGYDPLEVIVADDGSTDGTARVACGYPGVRLLSLAHGGVSAARNAAIAASRGALLAFLDSDDLWVPGKLDAQVGLLERNPHIGYCLCRMWNFLESGCSAPAWVGSERIDCVSGSWSVTSMVVRREIFDRIGGFDTAFTWGEDTDWLIRARASGIAYACLPEVYLRRRVHGTNLSLLRESDSPFILRLARKYIHRNRPGSATTGQTRMAPGNASVLGQDMASHKRSSDSS
jgi:glycosyltransferase involved in cell wall biosynthesis